MNALMREIPSPNVTHMLPLSFGCANLPIARDYTIISHGRGVFEFNPQYVDKLVLLKLIEKTFDKYKTHDAVYPVTITGAKTSGLPETADVGSHRFCTMDQMFAAYLTSVIKGRSVVDIYENNVIWEMINVSQYFRFMKYGSGGEHFPHYDSDFKYDYNYSCTKYSVVVYFNDCESGEIAFLDDNTNHSSDCTDWERQANESEMWLKIKPSCMKIVLFPHTLCHTVLPYTDKDSSRYICRGDILFRQFNVNRG